MNEQLYKPGDMVTIKHSQTSPMFNGETVIITKAEQLGITWVYEFVIPEQRGSAPQQLIGHRVGEGFKVPKPHETEWVKP